MARTKAFDNHSDMYDDWFIENKFAFQSELKAVKSVISDSDNGFEIGIGSGIFAEPLNIKNGIDPSDAMLEKAKNRGINAIKGIAEKLPYDDQSKDLAIMITSVCFVDDIDKAFSEANRVLKKGGVLIIGFVDKDSPVGKIYLEHKAESVFYKEATFYGTEELNELLKKNNFNPIVTVQTIFGNLLEIKKVQEVKSGYGEGSFVVIKAVKT